MQQVFTCVRIYMYMSCTRTQLFDEHCNVVKNCRHQMEVQQMLPKEG